MTKKDYNNADKVEGKKSDIEMAAAIADILK